MPLLFYLPFIIWMGLCEVAQNEMRVSVNHQGVPETRQ